MEFKEEDQQRPPSQDKAVILAEEEGRFLDMKSIRESLAEAEISAQKSLCAYKGRAGGDFSHGVSAFLTHLSLHI